MRGVNNMAEEYPNLIKNSDLTPEERKQKASNAGKASVKARRKKKELRTLLELALSQPQTENPDNDNYMGITLALMNKALNGDVRAFETIRDTIGQKPVDQVEQTLKGKTININITGDEDGTDQS